MKKMTLLILVVLSASCGTKSTTIEDKTANDHEMKTQETSEKEITVNLRGDSGYSVMKDTTGKFYINETDGNKMVFTYMVSEKGPEGTADGDKSEAIMFEFSESDLPISLSNDELKEVKMMYQKQCFCRDAGYYWITNGSLSVTRSMRSSPKYAVAASFKLEKVNHEINGVTATVVRN